MFADLFGDRTLWWKLPTNLKQWWWRETDYGQGLPSDELVQAIQEALDAKAGNRRC